MPRRVVTVADLEEAQDGALKLPPDALVTAAALDAAAARGIKILMGEAQAGGAPSPAARRAAQGAGVVALASDHAGYELKEYLKRFLADSGYPCQDLGTHSTDPVDYPDMARAVAEAVATGAAWRGIVVDGAGIGSAMAANKVPGARAALCYDRATARNSREHNDANVLSLGGRLLRPEEAREITAVWLETPFAGGRHQRRVDKIIALEKLPLPAPIPAAGATPDGDAASRQALIEAVARELLCRLGDQQACALRGLEIDELVCPGCDGRCAESCPVKSRRVLEAGADRLGSALGATKIPADLARFIDHTLLKAEASEADVRRLAVEAREFGFASVCVNPAWVPLSVSELRGTPVKVCTVAGFPLGATLASAKAFEAGQAVKLGATEVDMVINIGALKSGHYDQVQREIATLAEICHEGGALLKVIIEAVLLTDQEKVIACRLAQAAAADFVKTSTGFGPGGATAHDVELMRLVVGPAMGVKAAGGIRSYEDFEKMLAAGATRIGASASVKIMREAAGILPAPPARFQAGRGKVIEVTGPPHPVAAPG